MDNMEVS